MRERWSMTRRSVLVVIATGLVSSRNELWAEAPVVHLYKDPSCGCCGRWAKHLEADGFNVMIHETTDLQGIRKRLRVPSSLSSCHTAQIFEYAIEGHVPALAIRRLLDRRPDAYGLAVAGMPVGSPGMEGRDPEPYLVMEFAKDGQRPFMRFVGTLELSHSPAKQ